MESFFKELFAYSHYANQELIKIFKQYANVHDERSKKIFSHILNAHHIWNCRINRELASYGVWDEQAIEQFEKTEQDNFTKTTQIIDNADLGEVIHYKTSKGEPFNNSVQDILFHISNHLHRAQG